MHRHNPVCLLLAAGRVTSVLLQRATSFRDRDVHVSAKEVTMNANCGVVEGYRIRATYTVKSYDPTNRDWMERRVEREIQPPHNNAWTRTATELF